FWRVCVERPVPSQGGYNEFASLADAVAWAEERLAAAEIEDEVERETRPTPTPAVRRSVIDLGPYRIDPSALEPERITHQVVFELNAAPEQYKTMELLCGGEHRYDERYLSPRQLAAELQIDSTQYKLEQPIGLNTAWYIGHSIV